MKKVPLYLSVTAAAVLSSGLALAQNAGAGDTSGSAGGGNVKPSTAIQKDQGRSESTGDKMGSPSGGAPGVEGPAGSENGPTAKAPNQKQ